MDMSNIEKDIKNIKQYINLVLDKGYCDCNELNMISTGKYCDGSKNVAYSMQNILAERQQDKARIKELEVLEDDLKDKRVVYIDTPEFAENYIPKQKVKEIIYTIIDYKIPRATNNGYYYDYFIKQEYKNDFVKLFNKLLEDK